MEQEPKLITSEEELCPSARITKGQDRSPILGDGGCGVSSSVSPGPANNVNHEIVTSKAMALHMGSAPCWTSPGRRPAALSREPASARACWMLSGFLHPN